MTAFDDLRAAHENEAKYADEANQRAGDHAAAVAAKSALIASVADGVDVKPAQITAAESKIREAATGLELAKAVHAAATTRRHKAEVVAWMAEAAELMQRTHAAALNRVETAQRIDATMTALREALEIYADAGHTLRRATSAANTFNSAHPARAASNPHYAAGPVAHAQHGFNAPIRTLTAGLYETGVFGDPLPNSLENIGAREAATWGIV